MELVDKPDAVDALLLPVCASIQSSARFLEEVDTARQRVATELAFQTPLKVYETTSWLKEQFAVDRTEADWVNVWLDVVAWNAGYSPKVNGAGMGLLDTLRQTGKSMVAVFEGLEALYTSVSDAGVERAMRALLISLPQRLRSETRRPLGALIFARRDTVEGAVRQNLDQYRRGYASFALSWSEADVLEFAAWVAAQSQARLDPDSNFGALIDAQRRGKLARL